MPEIYLNGHFVPPEQATVSVMDRGFLFGDGVYEVIPSYGGHFLGLEEHLDRLEASLAAVAIASPLTREQWHDVLRRLIGTPPVEDQSVYLQVTRGAPASRNHLCPPEVAPTVLAMANPLRPRATAIAEQGIRCITRTDIRWQHCEIKSISLLAAVMLRREAEENGAMETIILRDDMVMEASTANVFAVIDGEIRTPPLDHGLLPGITRRLLLELVANGEIAFRQTPVTLAELQGAEEIWLSSSTREILPVTSLDGAPVGNGHPGPLWRRIDSLYQDFKESVRTGHV